ncbi:hypothetical protein EV702DRAFT_1123577 [Suillus placidus]|uniref:Uncharacterized protein n=1 Tax=Suillus placidus TaxID=48579 RepID=A0A9P6ZQ57_9AGAM|nr:hypothetical protein EV702DRAFT_1138752 [Suillus placidus]KAG1774637.1 hypothetical protein EV702DRAFT_1123577 [Suillus placidus]
MEPPTPISFRFSDLPTELALLIFKYAAQTTFAQHARYTTRNPYSSALSLSRVSKFVRRTVLPEILHTVLLPEARHVTAFVRALRMQKTYVDQQQHDLSLDYASHVHRMSIGEFRGPLQGLNTSLRSRFTPSAAELDSESDVSLLAPVILAVSSLTIDFGTLDILSGCLKHVCNSDVDLDVNHRDSPLPWSTKSLALSGSISRRWWPFVGSVHGYTFLASIQHLTLFSSTSFGKCLPFQCDCVSETDSQGSVPYVVPLWMARAPFKGLQTFSLAIPHKCVSSDKEIWVKLVTFPASLLPEPCTPEEIKTFIETGAGFTPFVLSPVFLYRKLSTF